VDGTITSFDAADALGWIDLDDGRRIRFGMSACKGFVPSVGARVRVGDDLQALPGNELKARSVELMLSTCDVEDHVWPEVRREFSVERRWVRGEHREVRVKRTLFDRDALHARSPVWAEAAPLTELATAPARPDAWRDVEPPAPHPFFAPWHDAILATAVGALELAPADDLPEGASRIGGDAARLVRPWPTCANGHGAMTLLLVVEGRDVEPLFGAPMRLTIHACPACLRDERHAWLGETGIAAVEWARAGEGTAQTAEPEERLPETRLAATPVLSFPRAWVFAPRLDVEGHAPVGGAAGTVLATKLLLENARNPDRPHEEEAAFAHDRHYAPLRNLAVGGFSPFRFARCRACARPMKQVIHLDDYITDGAFPDLFDGSNELTLLACDRTPACGGPERGLLIVDP
jgi:hypothetical protein